MTTLTTSRTHRTPCRTEHSPCTQPAPMPRIPDATLATVLVHVAKCPTLTGRQRQDLCSALRTIGRALGQPLEELPADPRLLRDRLCAVAPAASGISPRRWTNATSLARRAIRTAGIVVRPGRSRVPFAPSWTAVLRSVRGHTGIALSGLARYCTGHGIAPEDVTDAMFAAYLEELEGTDIRRVTRKLQWQTAVTWNRMVSTVPGWPQQRLTVPNHSRVYALPWTRFPASLKADLDAYLHYLASGSDILSPTNFKPLRPISVKAARHRLTAYVSALVHRGHDPHDFHVLADVVALPLVKDGLRFFLERGAAAGSTQTAQTIAVSVCSLARHWVGVEDAHLAALRKMCKRLDTRPTGLTDRNRDRLRQFDDPANRNKLLALPETLARKAARCSRPSVPEALCMQTALAVEMLLMVPMRRVNLVRLNLDRHFRRTGRGVVHLVIPGEEVKNGKEIAAVLPASVVRLLDLYLARYRPVLLPQPSPWLFPGLADRPKSLENMALQISETVKRETGLLLNVHLFRHIAAKLYLDANPGAYGVVRLLHGHKSVDTTTRYYCGAETGAAFQAYDQQVTAMRRSSVQARPAETPAKPTAVNRKRG